MIEHCRPRITGSKIIDGDIALEFDKQEYFKRAKIPNLDEDIWCAEHSGCVYSFTRQRWLKQYPHGSDERRKAVSCYYIDERVEDAVQDAVEFLSEDEIDEFDYTSDERFSQKHAQRLFMIYDLIASAWCPNANGKTIAHHRDRQPNNNDSKNLLWVSKCEHSKLHALYNIGYFKSYEELQEQIYRDNLG